MNYNERYASLFDPQVFAESHALAEQQLAMLQGFPEDHADFCRGMNKAISEADPQTQLEYFRSVVFNAMEYFQGREDTSLSNACDECLDLLERDYGSVVR